MSINPDELGQPLAVRTGQRSDQSDTDVPSWVDEALCAQTDPDLFFPEKGQPALPAKRICQRCPVRQQCLQGALDRNERHGIWGGLSPIERTDLLRTASAA